MPDLTALSGIELRDAYRARTLSPVEVTEATLRAIEERDREINAFVTVTADQALDDARAAEAAYGRGDAGAIAGVPYTLKDLVDAKGILTGRGSLVWSDPSPAADSPVTERLAAAGGVLLGKTTTPELGWKGDSGNPLNGPCRNPHDLSRTAGGSSGGSAAAAAANMGPLHQASDGAGSIRMPASFCGVTGIKPTFGTVPQAPPSAVDALSHIGPIARTVADNALLLDVMAGPDERDRLAVPRFCPSFLAALDEPPRRLRIAFSPDLGFARIDAPVAACVAEAVPRLRAAGHDVEEIALALDDPYAFLDAIWSTAQAAKNGPRLAETRDRLDPGLLEVVERGLTRSGPEVAAAYQGRLAFTEQVRRALAGYDLLACPTLPVVAFPAGDDHPGTVAGEPTTYLGWTQFTYPFNLTGQPALTIPCGAVDGLPVGLQLVGRRFDDATVLRAAADFERVGA